MRCRELSGSPAINRGKQGIGRYAAEHNQEFIYKKGKELGLDAVLLLRASRERGSQGGDGDYHLYLIDINRKIVYGKSGGHSRNLNEVIREALRTLLKEYNTAAAR